MYSSKSIGFLGALTGWIGRIDSECLTSRTKILKIWFTKVPFLLSHHEFGPTEDSRTIPTSNEMLNFGKCKKKINGD
jgi:hypothetical protein